MADHFAAPPAQDAQNPADTQAVPGTSQDKNPQQTAASTQDLTASVAQVAQAEARRAVPAHQKTNSAQASVAQASSTASTVADRLPDFDAPSAPQVAAPSASVASAYPASQMLPDQAQGAVSTQTAQLTQATQPTQGVSQPTMSAAQPQGAEPARQGRPVISLKNVTLCYPAQPKNPALDNISVDIYPGEFVFLVGHSGSGKSTFLKLLTRELKVSKGEVFVAGQDLTKLRNWKIPYLRRQIGSVFQDFKLLPDKTIYENVAFALECIGKSRSVIKAQVPEVLRLVGLGEKMKVYPDQLSGGEQQRVSVARAMVNRPPLLICDEPTGNLDPAISLGITKLLERINLTGTTILMATHDREMVDSMRRRVIALESGHIVRDQQRGGYGNYGSF